jgi:hypothetical protein
MCTPSGKTIQYFIVILSLATILGLSGHHQDYIYKKLKNAGAYNKKRQIYGVPFTFIKERFVNIILMMATEAETTS